MAVLSISRQFGAGGKALGQRLAKQLGWQLVYDDILAKVAEEAGVSPDWVEAVDREAGDRLMRLLAKVVPSDFIDRHLGKVGSDFDETRYAEFLRKIINSVAEHGDAVILGRGSQFILADDPDCFKVLLVATYQDRIDFLTRTYGVDEAKAKQMVDRHDSRRERFLKNFTTGDPNDPAHYHLVINTSQVGLDCAQDLVATMVRDCANKKG